MRLYFTALTSLQTLPIQYVPPKITINRNPNVAAVAIVGRNTPRYHYLGGTTEITLDLDFHSEQANREDVISKVKWLESLAYSDGFNTEPEQVRLTFGKLFRANEIFVIKAFSADLSLFDDNAGYLPRQAYVKLTLALDSSTNLLIEDIKWN